MAARKVIPQVIQVRLMHTQAREGRTDKYMCMLQVTSPLKFSIRHGHGLKFSVGTDYSTEL
jgi:hypothetical protein